MRLGRFIAALWAIVVVISVDAVPAAATDDKSSSAHHERVVHHKIYYPRYRHVYHGVDPYAYKYEPRGYYPYYNSGYWRSRRLVGLNRPHFKHPVYFKAWGANRKRYKHYRWHAKHHGRHDHAHW